MSMSHGRTGVPLGADDNTQRTAEREGGRFVVTKQTSIWRETAGYLSIMALLLYDIKNRLMYVAYFFFGAALGFLLSTPLFVQCMPHPSPCR